MFAPAPIVHTGAPKPRVWWKKRWSKSRGRSSRLKLQRCPSASCAVRLGSLGKMTPVSGDLGPFEA
jgi:hypothetical protein